jgi:hypothetical protein
VIDRLTSQDVPRKGRWGEMARHLNFAKGVDLSDVNEHDWPSVKKSIEGLLYSQADPIQRSRLKAIAIEVVDHVADRVRIGEHNLADSRRRHALRREPHDLRAPPRHDRRPRAAHDPQQPMPSSLVISRNTTLAAKSAPLAPNYPGARIRRPGARTWLRQAGKPCRGRH